MNIPSGVLAYNLASTLSVASTTLVSSHPLKYISTTEFVDAITTRFGGEPIEISTLDHYLYHGGLLLLFKGLLGPTSFNNEYLLSLLSLPAIQKSVIDLPQFQAYKRALGLKLILALLRQNRKSLARKIVFKAAMSYINQTPLKHFFHDINSETPPSVILERIKESFTDLSRAKLSSARIIIEESGAELTEIFAGHLNYKELKELAAELDHFIHNFSPASDDEVSLFSSQILSKGIGKSALYSLNPSVAITYALSKHATTTEVVMRVAGCLFSISSGHGLLAIAITETAVSILSNPISKALGDSGEKVSLCRRSIAELDRQITTDLRQTYGLRQKEIIFYKQVLLEIQASAFTFIAGYSLHPAIHSLTNLQIIQTIVPKPKKIDFFDAMLLQGATSITLTALNALPFPSSGNKFFLNLVAITVNNPFVMEKILKRPEIQTLTRMVRTQIPGLSISDTFSRANPLIETGTRLAVIYSPRFGRFLPVAIQTAKAAAILKKITDPIGGVDATIAHCASIANSTLNFYGNYVLFSLTASVFSPEIGVVAVGAGAGRNYSKISAALGIGIGSATFYLTQSPSITTLVVTAVHQLSERFFGRGRL